jgi:hypothetical protein
MALTRESSHENLCCEPVVVVENKRALGRAASTTDQSKMVPFHNLPESPAMNKRIKVIEPNVSVLRPR